MDNSRWKLTFEYDGTHFKGWQKQPGLRTVQGVIENAFTTLYQLKIKVAGQGRTDAGVHAVDQTAHTDLPDIYSRRRILHAMKGLLPSDVALLEVEQTEPGFHARFDAVARKYHYKIMTRQSPLNRFTSWYVYSELDGEKLHECAEPIVGKHDFVNFCIPPEDEHLTTLCAITESRWTKSKNGWIYQIEGNRFLRHLVRRLVGTMVRVSEGKLSLTDFKKLLEGEKTAGKGFAAPARGLLLEKVRY